MNDQHHAARPLLAFAMLFALAGCLNAQPSRWTLWYVPNEPKPGVRLAKSCDAYVFATAGQTEYAVALFRGWNGRQPPTRIGDTMYSGEDFTGTLALGPQVLHDDSSGYNLNVNVIYRVRAYIPAKLRADAQCGIAER